MNAMVTLAHRSISPRWDEVLARSRRRSNFGRRLRRLKALDGFEFRSVTSPAELSAAFDRFLDLHRKRRPGRASALSGSSQLVRFHRDVVARMSATGWLRFDELWCEGALRASIYAFDDGSTFYYYNTGFDTDWADRSVGSADRPFDPRGGGPRRADVRFPAR